MSCAERLVRDSKRYWHTVRHLRPVQIRNRLWRRIYRPRPDSSPAPDTRPMSGRVLRPPRRTPSMHGPDRFWFMHEEGRIDSPRAWNDAAKSDLWLYHLHSFDDLVAHRAASRREWHEALIRRWISDNPPTRGIGWDPHPTSKRIVNWIKWGFQRSDAALPVEVRHSLAVQTRWLQRRLEYHLLGNHLMANAKALCFAGLYFTGQEAASWYRTGWEIVRSELDEQVLADGGHFERSPMYHAIVLEDLLDLVNIHESYGRALPRARDAAGPMLSWLRTLCHPDGEIPFFNDAAVGTALTQDQLTDYARKLGISSPTTRKRSDRSLDDLPDTGYVRLEVGPAVALLDIAPLGPDYLPAHAHADTLSFELSLYGRRLLVNTGTSLYESGMQRSWERGTSAHNALVVDGENSSETWDSFRVGRRARVIKRSVDHSGEKVRVEGAHDGYTRLPGSPTHSREWHVDVDGMTVVDRIEGGDRHDASIWLHLHPSWTAIRLSASAARIEDRGGGDGECEVRFDGPGRLEIRDDYYAPEFGRTEPSQMLRYTVHASDLPLEIRTKLTWMSQEVVAT